MSCKFNSDFLPQFQCSNISVAIYCFTDASKAFKNLSKFSRLFKDKVAYPVIQLCRQGMYSIALTGFPINRYSTF